MHGISQFFIMSKALTPPLGLRGLPASNETLLLNGLICLQIYSKFRGMTTKPTIMLVDAIQNKTNNKVVQHAAYRDIFWALSLTAAWGLI